MVVSALDADGLRRAANTDNPRSFAARARAKRWREFQRRFPEIAQLRVLDLGGTPRYWRAAPVRPKHVTVVNLIAEPADEPWIDSVEGDVLALDLGEQFDLVVSNSLIEHIVGIGDRRRLVDAIEKHAPRHWVQTPNKYFPVEPHWLFPFMQFLPRKTRITIAQRWKFGHIRAESREQAKQEVDGIQLLGPQSMTSYFPDSEIWVERVFGLPKSLVAVKQ